MRHCSAARREFFQRMSWLDRLLEIVMRMKIKANASISTGRINHSHWMWTYVSEVKAVPIAVALSELVELGSPIVCGDTCIRRWRVMLFAVACMVVFGPMSLIILTISGPRITPVRTSTLPVQLIVESKKKETALKESFNTV